MPFPAQATQTLLKSYKVRGINPTNTDEKPNTVHYFTGFEFVELSNLLADQHVPYRIIVTTNPAIVDPPNQGTFAFYSAGADSERCGVNKNPKEATSYCSGIRKNFYNNKYELKGGIYAKEKETEG
jgi:hypothetical protein